MTKKPSLDMILGVKVGGVRVTPITLKIVGIFVVFLLLSNFITNYINLTLNRSEQIKLTTDFLVRDLKDLYLFSATQFRVYTESGKEAEIFTTQLAEYARTQFKGENSLLLAFSTQGDMLFAAGPGEEKSSFADAKALGIMTEGLNQGTKEGALNFTWEGQRYFGIYRYNSDWEVLMVRAEEWNEFYAPTFRILTLVSVIIIWLTVISAVIGAMLMSYILRFVRRITARIMEMQQSQEMQIIDMTGAPNDDVTYLGMAMNSLSSTIQNLVEMFRKFVARDVASQAYKDKEIRLEGTKRTLAIMFSDIKGFTFMTETLGNDIIKLINLHYNKAIRSIHEYNGDIGSIIGDAILAVFGTMTERGQNKSLEAVRAGFAILDVAEDLRQMMDQRRIEYEKSVGRLEDAAQKVYEAVLLEVGVGIDGGEVFYGNIGSNERMVNTVIGDNVNSSSRLEGLTRIYKVPMIVSEYIKNEVETGTNDFIFLELDMVQVKGKTIGKRIYTPIPQKNLDEATRESINTYKKALDLYYWGLWSEAHELFVACNLPSAQVFIDRTRGAKAPEQWSGIWTMKDK